LLNKKIRAALLAVLIILVVSAPVSAQEVNTGVEYIVQSGDTLTGIAARFGISVDALTSANGLSSPDQLYVGQVLVIPGVDWISGVLITDTINLGESFKSISRRFHLDYSTLARLGGFISPTQMYAGTAMLLPSGDGVNLSLGRAAISDQESILEIAAKENSNPWMLVAENQLAGQWDGLSGDVVFIPGTNNPGPGGLPSPISMEIGHGNFIQGKTTSIQLGADGQQMQLTGNLLGKTLNFMDAGDGSYVALQGVHVMTPPGIYPLTLSGATQDGESFQFSQMVLVKEGGYSFEKISVDPAYLDPVLDEAEFNFIAALTAPVTTEKMWSGIFVKPTPFDIFINSYFGTRRSYNGSAYTYYHSGIDFGGGQGAEVICPGRGKVVFAGPLEIRGNATIIDHGWGVYTGYWHQSEIRVQVGDIVEEGQIIGLVGNTGRSAGAHLHWEIWAGGIQVEPYDWLIEQFP
jgi:murein DD-endopeptidase MepM/ murein hydrolase activator NlpD